ncbi:hypothetical protein SAMN02787142_2103 [Burkholderia sp. WP9]|uniref:phage tail tip lysozyme n=1 Tax=Burkholderia sp. WP9 TaxID=1500263 RepID=UPI000897BC8A|nr:phage tail tip lysozyme [Burkholderia sp. WP9]SEC87218.1 hypothetical protein SAMN02787142_2103 [Burkholderia sp. WP9]
MSNQQVVSELIVQLTLDSTPYKRESKKIDGMVDGTEKKLVAADTKRKRRDTDQLKRTKSQTLAFKELASSVKAFTAAVGAIVGVGVAAFTAGNAFVAYENGLTRATVATGLSRREMQAASIMFKRLGADADAGAASYAELAKEAKAFQVGGPAAAPHLQALSMIGVNLAGTTTQQLAQAQQIYRAAPPGQKATMESFLALHGIATDLIVAIKSNRDITEEWSTSLSQATDTTSKTLDAFNDATASAESSLKSFGSTLASLIAPAVQQMADYLNSGAVELSKFADDVNAAGGGLDGFQKALSERSPELAHNLALLGTALRTLGEAVDLSAYGLQLLGGLLKTAGQWLFPKLGGTGQENVKKIGGAFGTISDAVKWAWSTAVPEARRNGPDIVGGTLGDHGGAARLTAPRQYATDPSLDPGETVISASARKAGAGVKPTAAELTQFFVARGVPLNEAIGLTANAFGESSLDPARVNQQSGARGLFQWLSKDRVAAVERWSGKPITSMSWQEQSNAVLNVPSERARLNKAVAGASTVSDYTRGISDVFEAHGNMSSLRDRLKYASQLEASSGGANGTQTGATYNVQNLNVSGVQDPQQLSDAIQRQSGTAPYNSAVR